MALPNLSELSPDVIPPPASTNIQTIERMNNQTSERFPWRFVVFYCKLVLFSEMLLWLGCKIAWLRDDDVCFRHVFEFLEALARVISAQPCLLFIQPFLISVQSPNKKHRRCRSFILRYRSVGYQWGFRSCERVAYTFCQCISGWQSLLMGCSNPSAAKNTVVSETVKLQLEIGRASCRERV